MPGPQHDKGDAHLLAGIGAQVDGTQRPAAAVILNTIAYIDPGLPIVRGDLHWSIIVTVIASVRIIGNHCQNRRWISSDPLTAGSVRLG